MKKTWHQNDLQRKPKQNNYETDFERLDITSAILNFEIGYPGHSRILELTSLTKDYFENLISELDRELK